MKMNLTHKNKLYSVYYRQLYENEALQMNSIRMHFLGTIAKYEPENNKIIEFMNKNDLNVEVYDMDVSN